jgi:hypothetical protein
MSACSCEQFYNQQASSTGSDVQLGGYFPVYRKYQSGGGIFSSLIRFIRPLIRSAAPIAKLVAKKVGKSLAKAALPVLAEEGIGAITDLTRGENIKQVVKKRAKNIAKTTGSRLAKKTKEHLQKFVSNQRGRGVKRKQRNVKSRRKRRRLSNKIINF